LEHRGLSHELFLDRGIQQAYFVNTVNLMHDKVNEELLGYQTLRLKDLIAEMLKCCEERKLIESQKLGLPYAELKCLMIFGGEKYLTVKGMAGKLDVAKSRVTKIVNSLTEKGLVERVDDPRDARIKLISRTHEGWKKSEEIEAFQKEVHRKILLQLGVDERKDVLSRLEVLRSAMEAVKEELF
jgi:DNA-binding MarR family transcriptional regulator